MLIKVNKRYKKGEKLNVSNVNDVYVTGNGDLNATDNIRHYIVKHSSSDLVVILFCNVLTPIGICRTADHIYRCSVRSRISNISTKLKHQMSSESHETDRPCHS